MDFPFSVCVTSRNRVSKDAKRFSPTHFVSLATPGTERARRPSGVSPENGLLLLCEDHRTEAHLSDAPTREQAAYLVAFAKRLPPGARVLLNCEAGVSRSTAAALVLLAVHVGVEHSEALWAYVKSVRPQANPNPLLLKYAAELLNDTEHRLETAVFGRG